MSDQRPKFLPSFLDAIKAESEITGWRAVVPYVGLACAALSAAVAYFLPAAFWSEPKQEIATIVYSGILTFDGLILALGWSAYARIYDVLLRGDFGQYLMKNNLLKNYILQVTFMHTIQVAAVVMAVVGLLSVLSAVMPLWLGRAIFGAAVMLMLYSIKQSADAVTAMNDLVWQSAFYEANRPADGSGNVTPLGERRGS
jgi:hypothetical protein